MNQAAGRRELVDPFSGEIITVGNEEVEVVEESIPNIVMDHDYIDNYVGYVIGEAGDEDSKDEEVDHPVLDLTLDDQDGGDGADQDGGIEDEGDDNNNNDGDGPDQDGGIEDEENENNNNNDGDGPDQDGGDEAGDGAAGRGIRGRIPQFSQQERTFMVVRNLELNQLEPRDRYEIIRNEMIVAFNSRPPTDATIRRTMKKFKAHGSVELRGKGQAGPKRRVRTEVKKVFQLVCHVIEKKYIQHWITLPS